MEKERLITDINLRVMTVYTYSAKSTRENVLQLMDLNSLDRAL